MYQRAPLIVLDTQSLDYLYESMGVCEHGNETGM